MLTTACATGTLQCSGQFNVSVINEDGEVQHVQVEGINLFAAYPEGTPLLAKLPYPSEDDYAGQNYVTINEHHIQLFPAGKLGLNHLYLFDLVSKTWDTIIVYCQPLGAAYIPSRDQISGFCTVNTSVLCVPYFTLALQNGRWTDVSKSGYCSNHLSGTNLTNSVILQNYSTDYEASVVKLYFAEQETNRIHEVDLVEYEAKIYHLPSYENHVLKSHHLVPAIAKDGSFHGLRIESFIDSSSSVYQTLASSGGLELEFALDTFNTPSTAFCSYELDYLVTFANAKTIVIIKGEEKSRTTKQFQLSTSLYIPIRCQNMPIAPYTHYMICLTSKESALLIIISDNEVTNQIIPNGNSSITDMKWLTENTFYLLNDQNQTSFFVLTPGLLWLGDYAVSSGNIRIVSSSGGISCSSVAAKDNHNNLPLIIAASTVGTIILMAVAIVVIIILLKCSARKRFKNYKMVDTDSQCSSIDSSNSDDHTDEANWSDVQATGEMSNNHPSLDASLNQYTGGIHIPTDHNYRGNSDLSNTSHSFTIKMHTPKQCTSHDTELPRGYRPPPTGSPIN